MTSTPDGARWDGPPLEAWSGAWTPAEVAARLAGVGVPWCIVGGWSIDLALGEVTREHEDLELAILRPDHLTVRRQLRPLAFRAVGDGEIRLLGDDEVLPERLHQSWGLDEDANEWRVDVMIEPGDADTWIYRRDESISAPRSFMVGVTDDGIPHLRPHGALLYKALPSSGEIRPKDQADFDVAAPRLADDERAWLVEVLTRLRPEHEWLGALRGSLD